MTKYYQILGLSQTAGLEEIKKSYKTLSKLHHPDRPNGDEERFKEINIAYETLSDPDKRRQYDLSLSDKPGTRCNRHGGRQCSAADFAQHSQAFDMFFKPPGQTPPCFFHGSDPYQPRSNHLTHNVCLSLQEVFTGVVKRFRIKRYRLKENMELSLEEKIMTIKVPAGMSAGKILTVKGEGNQSLTDKVSGDVYIHFTESGSPDFVREGVNLHYHAKIPLKTSLCGGPLVITRLDGSHLEVNLDKVTKPGESRVIAGEGLPVYDHPVQRGDLIIKFEVEFPLVLSPEIITQLSTILP